MDNQPQLFLPTEDSVIIRTSKGVYKQSKIARRGDHVYASLGSGFVMLYANGITSCETMKWEYMENASHYKPGKLGRLVAA